MSDDELLDLIAEYRERQQNGDHDDDIRLHVQLAMNCDRILHLARMGAETLRAPVAYKLTLPDGRYRVEDRKHGHGFDAWAAKCEEVRIVPVETDHDR